MKTTICYNRNIIQDRDLHRRGQKKKQLEYEVVGTYELRVDPSQTWDA